MRSDIDTKTRVNSKRSKIDGAKKTPKKELFYFTEMKKEDAIGKIYQIKPKGGFGTSGNQSSQLPGGAAGKDEELDIAVLQANVTDDLEKELEEQDEYLEKVFREKRFGKNSAEIQAHIGQILSMPVLQDEIPTRLRSYLDSLDTHIRGLASLEVTGETYSAILAPLLISRIPNTLRMEWSRKHHASLHQEQYKDKTKPINTDKLASTSDYVSSVVAKQELKSRHILLGTAMVQIVTSKGRSTSHKPLFVKASVTGKITELFSCRFRVKLGLNQDRPKVNTKLLSDEQFGVPGDIDMLLEGDVYAHLICDGILKGSNNELVAHNTIVDYILTGVVNQENERYGKDITEVMDEYLKLDHAEIVPVQTIYSSLPYAASCRDEGRNLNGMKQPEQLDDSWESWRNQLNSFADASESAYTGAVYIRSKSEDKVTGGAPASILSVLDRIQNKAIRLVDETFSTDCQLLSHRRTVSSLCLFYCYFHGFCSAELAATVPSPYRPVSWIRERDLHILTVGTFTYTRDKRFTTRHPPDTNDWILQITRPNKSDGGIYECQIGTSPKRSLYVKLTVLESITTILGEENIYVKKGSSTTLTCIVKTGKRPPDYILWYHDGEVIKHDYTSNIHDLVDVATTTSHYIIETASPSDAGQYTCAPSKAANTSTNLYIVNNTEQLPFWTKSRDKVRRDVRHAVTFTKMVEASIDSSDEDIFQNYAGKNGIKPYRFEPKRRRLNVDQHEHNECQSQVSIPPKRRRSKANMHDYLITTLEEANKQLEPSQDEDYYFCMSIFHVQDPQ
ncbi:Hemicentin-2 [Nymphon striatum]|nr:Hemicentin-2 [Nymphon striatum]